MELIPLQRSAEYDDIESELKSLFLSLYQAHIAPTVRELMLYGMPNLGSDQFISRELNNDGLAVLRDTNNEDIRYLFHAWRYRNPQRGTAFLETYLRALFGPVYTISQLWCPKTGRYPDDAVSKDELLSAGHNLDDYFLTSRIRVDIETEIVPQLILKAALTAVAARIVLELRAARRVSAVYPVGFIAYPVVVCRTIGSALYLQPQIESPVDVGAGAVAGGSNFTYSVGGSAQSHLN